MGSFRQLGDPVCPVCPPCLCQHHGAAYAELAGTTPYTAQATNYTDTPNGGTIISRAITITERCCICVNAATLLWAGVLPTALEIERPLGTIRTQQEDVVTTNAYAIMHHAAWEVLDPGTYTYYLVNRSGATLSICAAWLKIIASDCEG